MADIFDELLGDDAVSAPQMIAALRKQNALGVLGSLSGDKSIASLGGGLSSNAMQSAEGIRDRRDVAQNRADQVALSRWQQLMASRDRHDKLSLDERKLAQDRELGLARIRAMGGVSQAAAAKEARDNRKRMDSGTRQLEAALRTGKGGQLWTAIGSARKLLDKYAIKDDKGNVTGYKTIPGVGGIANVRTQGIGTASTHLTGAGEEGRTNQALLAPLMNLTLAARSGAAVTDPELNRMLAEVGLTSFSTDADFVKAFPRLANSAESYVGDTLAGYDPEVVEAFLARGGLKGWKGQGGAKAPDSDVDPDMELLWQLAEEE